MSQFSPEDPSFPLPFPNAEPSSSSSLAPSGLKVCLNLAPFTPEAAGYPLRLLHILNVNETEASDLVKALREKHGAQEPASTKQHNASGPVDQAQRNLEYLVSLLPQTSVIITLGEHGVLASHINQGGERQPLQLRAHATKVVETTGAGDTFGGFFLASLAKGETFKRSLELGGIAAAISVSRRGAMESIPSLQEVLQSGNVEEEEVEEEEGEDEEEGEGQAE